MKLKSFRPETELVPALARNGRKWPSVVECLNRVASGGAEQDKENEERDIKTSALEITSRNCKIRLGIRWHQTCKIHSLLMINLDKVDKTLLQVNRINFFITDDLTLVTYLSN